MDTPADQLVVRQHQRHACRLDASVSVAPDSPTRVAISRSVGDGSGVFSATVVDCSSGGLGLESNVYLPRDTRLSVRIRLGASSGHDIELGATVQRAQMISRTPRYYLGLAFGGEGAPSPDTLSRILRHSDTADGQSRRGDRS